MRSVVVGVDRSQASLAAVRWAADEAALHDSTLTLVHAWDEPVSLSVALSAEDLASLAGTARASLSAVSVAQPGKAAQVLDHVDADLVVLGSHVVTTGAFRHASHLARHVLHHARVPLALVPDTELSERRRVVVGVTSSACSRAALRWAATEARAREATLVAANAWQVHPGSFGDVVHPGRAISTQQVRADHVLHDIVEQALGTVEGVELCALHGGPLDQLLALTDEADLLVVGRTPHGAFRRLIGGSLGDDIGDLSRCPVVAIPGD